VSERVKQHLKTKMRAVTSNPGVYLMKDRLGSIIYVGKAKSLKKRLGSYFTPSRKTTSDLKTRALIDSIYDFDVHEVRNEAEALILETKLIKDYRPRYNILMRDDKRFLIVRVQMKDPYPTLILTRIRKNDGAYYFGPFVHANALHATIEWLNKKFELKTRSPQVPRQLNHEEEEADSQEVREAYRARVQAACDLLSGKGKRSMLQSIKEEMQQAAAQLHFEKAAKLRNVFQNLEIVLNPARQFSKRGKGIVPSTINIEEDLADLGRHLNIGYPPKVMECFDISNISSTHIVASMVRFIDGKPDNQSYRRYRIKSVEGQDDFASMAEVVRRRYRHIVEKNWKDVPAVAESQEDIVSTLRRLGNEGKLPVMLPDLVIVDGGKGQLTAAMKQMAQLGLQQVPLVGLAKQREEIFFPNQSEPLLIPHHEGALKLMQRIRDEAHRFANNFNELLLRRRIRESMLDDCPGMNKSRKTHLFKKYDSIAAMKRASPEALQEIPGIGKKTAEQIVEFLQQL
jgi:excinuclease ABC subunit C